MQEIEVTPANVYDGHMLMPLVESMELPKDTEVLAENQRLSVDRSNCLQSQARLKNFTIVR